LAYQPSAISIFLSEQTSHQQSASNTFLSEQISISHQPPAKRTGCLVSVTRANSFAAMKASSFWLASQLKLTRYMVDLKS
jgi:hypothetical protein